MPGIIPTDILSKISTGFSLLLGSVQLLSRVWLFATPWTTARQASLSITNSWSLPKPMSIKLVMPSSHLILCCPLLLPSIFPIIRVFSFYFIFPFFFFFQFTILYWFCHTSTWIHYECTRVPHPEPPSTSLPIPSLWVIPVHQPRASCIMHQTWTGDSFHICYWYNDYFFTFCWWL